MFRRLFETPHQRARRLATALGWSVVDTSGIPADQEACTARAADALAHGGVEAFIGFYDAAFASKQIVGDSVRCYALAEPVAELAWDDPEITAGRAQLKLKLFAQAYEDMGHAPAAGALYAKALLSLASLHTEADWTQRLSKEAAERRAQCEALAKDVFETTAVRAGDCALWHRTRFQVALSEGCETDELEERFSAALNCDAGEHGLYTERACQLLPRWHGSFAELETFARVYSALTEADFGGTLYARIYTVIARQEHLRDTDVDWDHLKASMQAWCDQTGSQYLLNVFASMADAFGDDRTLARLLAARITSYYPAAWLAAEQAADVFFRMTPAARKAGF